MAPPKTDSLAVTLFCDGASRGNPGPSAFGFAILGNDNQVLAKCGGTIGKTTNNVAEYQALVEGLKKALELGADRITVKCDSELMVKQVRGLYRVKAPHLIPLCKEAKDLLSSFLASKILHIPREENSLADSLANDALDGRLSS